MCLSSIPKNKSEYTTRIMATYAVSVMDHLGWKKAHVFGHSMSGMIACKLAALFPDRILSLSLLNVTGGQRRTQDFSRAGAPLKFNQMPANLLDVYLAEFRL